MANDLTNFDIDQGADFRADIQLLDAAGEPVDVSSALIIGQVRRTVSSADIDAVFSIDPTDLANGKFGLLLSAAATSKLKCDSSPFASRNITQFAYDVEVHYNNGRVDRILTGILNVSPEVTR